MLLKRMKYFAAVVECGSFTEAATKCFISQSAVSQQMAALEAALGVKLLERNGRGFRLTKAGELFYSKGKELLLQVEDLCTEVSHMGENA